MEKKTLDPGFWDDSDSAQDHMVDLNDKKKTIDSFEELEGSYGDMADLLELLSDEEYHKESGQLESEFLEINKKYNGLKTQALLSGEYDHNNCYFSIHAGSGGMEATDWAQMLQRMYERWFESRGWKVEMTAISEEEGAGIKSVNYLIKGPYAYGYCKGEKGVHRLVRISPFDSQSRRHTSFSSIDVYPEIKDIGKIEIDEKDLKIDTYRSSGKGGQHVNTTDSAVRITHLPTGVVATCQNERSQIQNRVKAYEELVAKLVQIKEEERKERIEDIQGKYTQISWGNQIRSYVFQPYTMVKDHRTGCETSNVAGVMDGNLDDFIDAYLNWKAKEEENKQ